MDPPAVAWRTIAALVAPPLCGACASPCAAGAVICADCAAELAGARGGTEGLRGVGLVTWAAPYEGVARSLVTALKFGQRLPLARVAAATIATRLDPPPDAGVVAVPPAPSRHRRRGFDPAQLIAGELADLLRLRRARPLRRSDGPRQVGRRRAERLSDPPRVLSAAAPEVVLLVDDVLTTGATLAACAEALRRGGAREIVAATFARA